MAKDTRPDSPWAGAKPRTERLSRRERERLAEPGPRPSPSPARDDRRGARSDAPSRSGGHRPVANAAPSVPREAPPSREQRLYGLNACLAAFARRPEALRKVYLGEARIGALKAV